MGWRGRGRLQRVALVPPCACAHRVAPDGAFPVRVAAVVGAQVGIRILAQHCVCVGHLLRPRLAGDPAARDRLTAEVANASAGEVLIALPGEHRWRGRGQRGAWRGRGRLQRVALVPPCACAHRVAPDGAFPVRVAAVVGAQVGIRILAQHCVCVGHLLRPRLAGDPAARDRLTAEVANASADEVLIALPGEHR